jgi:hypothetical protein
MLEEMMPSGVGRDFIATTVSKEIYIAELAAWPTVESGLTDHNWMKY